MKKEQSGLQPWKAIEDLPSEWPQMQHPEISVLGELWRERRARLEDLKVVNEFHARQAREWSIETGILERIYDIDRGTTVLLIERGIDATLIPHGATDRDANLVVAILKDHLEVLEGLFQFVSGKQLLTNFYIRQLHQVLTRHQEKCQAVDSLGQWVETDLQRGVWKTLPNNPSRDGLLVHEYCPPEHVQSEMDRLMSMFESHQGTDALVEAAFLHHRFTQIHPFQDGNGRVARCLANIVLIRAGLQPLVLTRDDRDSYIDALEAADEGNLSKLVNLFAAVEKRSFLSALSLSTHVIDQAAGPTAILKAAATGIRARVKAAAEQRLADDNTTTERLAQWARKRLDAISEQFRSELFDTEFECLAQSSSTENEYYFRAQIVECARQLLYFANLNQTRKWVRLTIRNGFKTDIVFSFHRVGRDPTELLCCSAFVSERASEGDDRGFGIDRACDQPFVFTASMPTEDLLGNSPRGSSGPWSSL